MKPSVYVETTVFSYITSRPSRKSIVAAHQMLSRQWWSTRRHLYNLYISDLVMDEAGKGDRTAASRRISYLETCTMLRVDVESLELADSLVRQRCVPTKAGADAVYIAVAAVNGANYQMTWNCTHINNAAQKRLIESVCLAEGYRCPVICTPEELMGDRS